VEEDSIEQGGGPEKRIYGITRAGRQVLNEWFTSGVAREHQRDEFYIKLILSVATGEANPRKVIQTQRTTLYQDLHLLTAQRNKLNAKNELAQIFLFDKAIMHLEADLRWLDLIEGRIEEVKRQPLPEPEVKPRGRPKKEIRS
jgi:DNA-binding PadR family transcriptional regulator